MPFAGLDKDNNVRADSTVEKLSKLRTVFDTSSAGTLTAGNSTPLTDGAAAVLLASEDWAKQQGLPVKAWLTYGKTWAVDFATGDEGLLMAPAYAVSSMLKDANLSLQDFDFYELHEAFAAQVLCTLKAWESAEYLPRQTASQCAAGHHRPQQAQHARQQHRRGPSICRHRRAHPGRGREAVRGTAHCEARPDFRLHGRRHGRHRHCRARLSHERVQPADGARRASVRCLARACGGHATRRAGGAAGNLRREFAHPRGDGWLMRPKAMCASRRACSIGCGAMWKWVTTPKDVEHGKGYVLQIPEEKLLLDIQACINVVKHAGPVGVIGYCWGGSLAHLAACELTVRAAVDYYGTRTLQNLHRKTRAPVLYHFGDRDKTIPPEGIAQIRAADPGGEFHVYAADHGFNCDHRAAYDAAAAKLARERTLDFLARHLRAAAMTMRRMPMPKRIRTRSCRNSRHPRAIAIRGRTNRACCWSIPAPRIR